MLSDYRCNTEVWSGNCVLTFVRLMQIGLQSKEEIQEQPSTPTALAPAPKVINYAIIIELYKHISLR